MSDHPEAMRLADRLDLWGDQGDLLEAAAELRRQHDEIEQLKAERDALKAAAEKGTEYVLAHINQDLKAERDALLAERDALLATLPGAVYLDPPDGGDVDVVEQFSRMAKDAERYRRLRMATREQLNDLRDAIFWGAEYLDAAIDAARAKP